MVGDQIDSCTAVEDEYMRIIPRARSHSYITDLFRRSPRTRACALEKRQSAGRLPSSSLSCLFLHPPNTLPSDMTQFITLACILLSVLGSVQACDNSTSPTTPPRVPPGAKSLNIRFKDYKRSHDLTDWLNNKGAYELVSLHSRGPRPPFAVAWSKRKLTLLPAPPFISAPGTQQACTLARTKSQANHTLAHLCLKMSSSKMAL